MSLHSLTVSICLFILLERLFSSMSKIAKKKPKLLMRTGYGLHTDRLVYSQKSLIRSIKFPLVVKDELFFKDFCAKIKADYLNCVGGLALIDWSKNEQSGRHHYSVFDFWLDSLRAGVVFFDKKESVKEFLRKEVTGVDRRQAFKDYFSQNTEIEKFIDLDGAYEKFISSTGARVGSKDEKKQLVSLYRSIVKQEYKYKEAEFSNVVALVKKIKETSLFKVDTKWIPIEKTRITYQDPFLIFDDIPFEANLSAQDLLERSAAKSSNNGLLNENQLSRHLGLLNKQAAFSNYFNFVVNELCFNPD